MKLIDQLPTVLDRCGASAAESAPPEGLTFHLVDHTIWDKSNDIIISVDFFREYGSVLIIRCVS